MPIAYGSDMSGSYRDLRKEGNMTKPQAGVENLVDEKTEGVFHARGNLSLG